MKAQIKENDYLMPLEVSGIPFRNNFVVGSGPAVKTLDMITEIERYGWGGASLKLAIDPTYISKPPRYRWLRKHKYHAFTAETRLTFEEGLRLMEKARTAVSELVLYANMAYAGQDGDDGWIRMAKKYEEAGAHVIELNMCCPNMSFNVESSGGPDQRISALRTLCSEHPGRCQLYFKISSPEGWTTTVEAGGATRVDPTREFLGQLGALFGESGYSCIGGRR